MHIIMHIVHILNFFYCDRLRSHLLELAGLGIRRVLVLCHANLAHALSPTTARELASSGHMHSVQPQPSQVAS